MARYINFKKVREQINMEDLLSQYKLLSNLTRTKTGWKGNCPFTKKQSKQKPFKADAGKNLWKCFCSDCKAAGRKGGNTLDFIVAMEGCDIRQAAEKAVDWFNIETNQPPNKAKRINQVSNSARNIKQQSGQTGKRIVNNQTTRNKPLSFQLKELQSQHPYFKKQGLNRDTVKYFGLGYYSGKGMMSNRVVVPIHNLEDKLVAYIGKDPKEVKADLYPKPENFNPSLEIYNLNRLKDLSPTEIDLYFDLESLWFYYQDLEAPAVALLTDTISQEQIKLLNEAFDEPKPLITVHSSSSITEAKLKEVVYQLAKNGYRIELSIV